VERVVDVDAHEGPVYVSGEDALYFTSVPRPGPRVDIKRLELGSLEVSVVRPDANAETAWRSDTTAGSSSASRSAGRSQL
jgi:hypothetical protein